MSGKALKSGNYMEIDKFMPNFLDEVRKSVHKEVTAEQEIVFAALLGMPPEEK